MDAVFRELADPSRRTLQAMLNRENGQTPRDLSRGLDMSRQAVSKHLAVLEASNLVATMSRGRKRLHFIKRCPDQ